MHACTFQQGIKWTYLVRVQRWILWMHRRRRVSGKGKQERCLHEPLHKPGLFTENKHVSHVLRWERQNLQRSPLSLSLPLSPSLPLFPISHHFPFYGEQGQLSGQSGRLVIERSWVRIPAGVAGEKKNPGSACCALISVSVPPPCYRSST